MSSTTVERVSVLESQVTSLRGETERLKARQQRMDSSVVQLIRTWQPLLLTAGETIIDIAKSGNARSSSLKRLRKGMAAIREMLPSVSEGESAQERNQA